MCTSSASWLLLVIGHPRTGHFSRYRDDLEGPGSFKSSRSNLAAGTRTTARAAGSRSTELFGSWTIFSTSAIRPRSSSCSSLPSLSSTSSSLTSCPALLRLLSWMLNIARIANAVQVTLWLSITNPQRHDSSFFLTDGRILGSKMNGWTSQV